MSSFMKVFLLLAVIVYISKAQQVQEPRQCLCQRVRDRIGSKTDIKDIHIYPANTFCNKVEIVVTIESGLRYCLNPKLEAVQKLMASIMKTKTSTTTRPTEITSNPLKKKSVGSTCK